MDHSDLESVRDNSSPPFKGTQTIRMFWDSLFHHIVARSCNHQRTTWKAALDQVLHHLLLPCPCLGVPDPVLKNFSEWVCGTSPKEKFQRERERRSSLIIMELIILTFGSQGIVTQNVLGQFLHKLHKHVAAAATVRV